MRSIKHITERFFSLKAKYFPERQLFLRSEGHVRFVTFSSNLQVTAAMILSVAVGWGIVTSYTYLAFDYAISEKNDTIARINKDYQSLSSDFSTLEKSIEKRAARLEERHKFLEDMVGLEGADDLDTPNATDTNIGEQNTPDKEEYSAKDSMLDQIFGGGTEPQSPLNSQRRRIVLMDRLNDIAQSQEKTSLAMLSGIQSQIQSIDEALAPSKLTTDMLVKQWVGDTDAMGGPYIPEAGFKPIFDAEDGALFNDLYNEWQRLEIATNALQSFPHGKPAEKYYISSRFGPRRDPINETWARHSGLDMAGWLGTKILATAAGRVVRAQWYGPYGKMIEIEHDNGFKTRYGHMRKLTVKKGQMVKLGEKIGEMGKTGRVTDTHLHYEVWFNNKVQNPLPYMKAANHVLKIQENRKRTKYKVATAAGR